MKLPLRSCGLDEKLRRGMVMFWNASPGPATNEILKLLLELEKKAMTKKPTKTFKINKLKKIVYLKIK